jgi:hypothetical protein
MIRFHLHAILALDDSHLCESPNEVRHHAGVARVQMGDENKGNAGIGRHMGEELLKGLQSTGGSADTDNWEVSIRAFAGGCLVSCGGGRNVTHFTFMQRFYHSFALAAPALYRHFLFFCHMGSLRQFALK